MLYPTAEQISARKLPAAFLLASGIFHGAESRVVACRAQQEFDGNAAFSRLAFQRANKDVSTEKCPLFRPGVILIREIYNEPFRSGKKFVINRETLVVKHGQSRVCVQNGEQFSVRYISLLRRNREIVTI